MSENGEPIVDRWRDGDARCHCTHCDACGLLFRTEDLATHQRQAHLGGKAEHAAHQQAGCDMLVALHAGIRAEKLEAWAETELRLRDVRDFIAGNAKRRRRT